MRRIVTAVLIVLLLVAAPVVVTQATQQEKVNVCHKTASESNPWVVQSVNANQLQSHLDNGDKLYQGPLKENGKPDQKLGDEWCNEQNPEEPTDLCPNIEGVQASLREGLVLNDEGECVEQTTTEPTPTPEVNVEQEVTSEEGGK